jgi:hypothetical protein
MSNLLSFVSGRWTSSLTTCRFFVILRAMVKSAISVLPATPNRTSIIFLEVLLVLCYKLDQSFCWLDDWYAGHSRLLQSPSTIISVSLAGARSVSIQQRYPHGHGWYHNDTSVTNTSDALILLGQRPIGTCIGWRFCGWHRQFYDCDLSTEGITLDTCNLYYLTRAYVETFENSRWWALARSFKEVVAALSDKIINGNEFIIDTFTEGGTVLNFRTLSATIPRNNRLYFTCTQGLFFCDEATDKCCLVPSQCHSWRWSLL